MRVLLPIVTPRATTEEVVFTAYTHTGIAAPTSTLSLSYPPSLPPSPAPETMGHASEVTPPPSQSWLHVCDVHPVVRTVCSQVDNPFTPFACVIPVSSRGGCGGWGGESNRTCLIHCEDELDRCPTVCTAQHSTAQHSTAQHRADKSDRSDRQMSGAFQPANFSEIQLPLAWALQTSSISGVQLADLSVLHGYREQRTQRVPIVCARNA